MHALVGANNAGKSTILRALDFLFNASTSKITDESFWHRDTSLKIWIEAEFDDLSESEKAAMDGYLKIDGSFHFARSAAGKLAGDGSDGDGKFSIGQHSNSPQPAIDWLNESKIDGKATKEWIKNPNVLVFNGKSFAEAL